MWLEAGVLWGTRGVVWAYVATVVIAWMMLKIAADRWWPGTAIMMGPRWLLFAAGCALVPLMAVLRPRLLLPLVPATLFVPWGIMNLQLGWPGRSHDPPLGLTESVRIATCNLRHGNTDWSRVLQMLDTQSPDVIALQDTTPDQLARLPAAWHHVSFGHQTIASPFPIRDALICAREPSPDNPSSILAVYAIVETLAGPLAVCCVNLYLDERPRLGPFVQDPPREMSLRERLRTQTARRERESRQLREWIEQLPAVDVILGDFDMPVESRVYRSDWRGFTNAFSKVGRGLGYTRSMSAGNVRFGVRTEHVLVGARWGAVSWAGEGGQPRMARIARIELTTDN